MEKTVARLDDGCYAPSMEAALAISGLSKHFGKTKAVDNLTFSVQPGEMFGFLGPNGAGKTTTIRCIMDFIRPTAGQVHIFGRDAQRESVAVKHDLGYLSGNTHVVEKWTGHEHIEWVRRTNGGQDSAAELIRRFDFDPKRHAHHLSSGNRQKLGLILALMTNPKLIILDEPTNALDPLMQNTLYTVLRERTKQGSTVFMSSHNLAEVERVCDRVAIIRQGTLVTVERIADLKDKHIHRLQVTFDRPVNSQQIQTDGVTVEVASERTMTIKFQGDLPPLLAKLAKLPVKTLDVKSADLEDIFLTYYR